MNDQQCRVINIVLPNNGTYAHTHTSLSPSSQPPTHARSHARTPNNPPSPLHSQETTRACLAGFWRRPSGTLEPPRVRRLVVGLVAGRQVDLAVASRSSLVWASCRIVGGGQVCGAHREDDRRVPGRGVALPHGIAGLAVHHLQGRLLVRTPRPLGAGTTVGAQCSLYYLSMCVRRCVARGGACGPHSTKYPLYLLSNERELWTAITALNINVAYLCASQVCTGERECSLPPPQHTMGNGVVVVVVLNVVINRGRAGVPARQAPDPTNPPQPAAAPSKPQPRRVRNSHRATSSRCHHRLACACACP